MKKQNAATIEFAEAWVNRQGDKAQESIKKISSPLEKKACQLLLQDLDDMTEEEKSVYLNKILKQIDSSIKLDINIYSLLIRLAINHAYLLRKVTELHRLFQVLQNIDYSKLCDACRGAFYSAIARKHLSEKGICPELTETSYKAFQCHEVGSQAWYVKKVYWVYNLTNTKEVVNLKEEINDLKNYPQHRYATHTPEYLLSNYYQFNFELAKALKEIEKIKDDEQFPPDISYEVFSDKIRLMHLALRFQQADTETKKFAKKHPNYVNTIHYRLALYSECIIKKEYEQAKMHIKEILSKKNQLNVLIILASKLYLEAELSQRNIASAERILMQADPSQEGISFTPFWVRLYLLKGDNKKACFFFSRIINNRQNPLSYFLLANELSTQEYAQLLLSSERYQPTPPKLNTPSISPKQPSPTIKSIDKLIIGKSEQIVIVKKNIALYAKQSTPVLITGDTGTGKEETAKLLHQLSNNADKPFMPVNCGAISETLMEAELFGYKKGAFTGALNDHKGLFESAGEGTVFLDEISSMPMKLQASLLRVLENMKIRPLGSTKFIPIKAKIIAATNVRLEDLVEQKSFRLDLYFRLNRLQINLPPLAEREGDIPLLIKHFINFYFNDPEVKLSPDLMQAMCHHPWPGNVRELKNEIERMAIIAGNNKTLTNDLVQFTSDPIQINKESNVATRLPSHGDNKVTLPSAETFASRPEAPKKFGARNHAEERREQLKRLFQEHKHLTRSMAMRLLGCATNTVANDLKVLVELGFITKVTPTSSPRSSYFVIKQ